MSEEPLLVRAEEIVAPADRRPQCLLALGQVAGAPGREPEPVVEGRHQLRESHLGGPRGNELDRERQSIQPPADLGHERSRRQLSAGRAGTADEQLFRIGGRKRRDLELVLPVQVEPSAARREHTQTRGAFQQLAHCGRGIEELLEVVQEQQELAAPQLVVQALLGQPERLRDRGADECRIDERRQPDEPDAVGEGVGELVCRAERNACLAGTTRAGQRHETSVTPEQGRDHLHLFSAPDDRRRGCGQMPTLTNRLRLDLERSVLTQDRALKRAQLRGRREPELVERAPDLGIGLERGGLPAGAVEPEHQEAAQALSQRMLGHEALELRQVERQTECQRRLGAILDRHDAQLLQAFTLDAESAAALQASERRTAPESKRVLERCERFLVSTRAAMLSRRLEQAFEFRSVEPVGMQPVAIAVPVDLDPGLAQLGDVDLQRVRGTRRGPLTPDGVHETFPRRRRAAREHERDEERPRLRAATERLPTHLEWPQDPELHDPSSLSVR